MFKVLQSAGLRALICVVATAVIGGLLTLHGGIDYTHYISALVGSAGGGGIGSLLSDMFE